MGFEPGTFQLLGGGAASDLQQLTEILLTIFYSIDTTKVSRKRKVCPDRELNPGLQIESQVCIPLDQLKLLKKFAKFKG